MACKAELFGDREIRERILGCSDFKQIKALGRKVRGFDQAVSPTAAGTMACKAELFGDREIRERILGCSDFKQIKALGRKVRGFDQAVWDKFKYAVGSMIHLSGADKTCLALH